MYSIPHDKRHKIIRYVMKIGDIEDASHTFLDLLQMKVINHENFSHGSAEGNEDHLSGLWSRCVIGYTSDMLHGPPLPCLQLTFNHGIEKYTRGNLLDALEIQVKPAIIKDIKEAGIASSTYRGQETYVLTCDGYCIHVVKSPDSTNRISRVILNCADSISLDGETIHFWTFCLGFEVTSWSAHPAIENDTHSRAKKCGRWCCLFLRKCRCKTGHQQLEKGEEPYVELQYGGTKDFYVRLQMLADDHLEVGSGREKLMITCSLKWRKVIESRVRTDKEGSTIRSSFQLVPSRGDLLGVVAFDANDHEVVYYCYEDVKEVSTSQLDAESNFRKFMTDYLKAKEARKRKKRKSSLLLRFSI